MNERQVILQDGLAHAFTFSESAIRHASVVNYTLEKDVLINIFIRSRGGRRSFVVNSKIAGNWGEELILPLGEAATQDARIDLLFEGNLVTVRQEGGEPITFQPERKLPSQMRLIFPPSIRLHEQGGSAEAPEAVQAPPPAVTDDAAGAAPAAEAPLPVPIAARGFVDFQGCLGEGDLWVAAGWTSDFAAESAIGRTVQLRMAFAGGDLVTPAVVCFHERPDLKGAGIGFLVMAALPEEGTMPRGKFSHAEITLAEGAPLRAVSTAVTSTPPQATLQQ